MEEFWFIILSNSICAICLILFILDADEPQQSYLEKKLDNMFSYLHGDLLGGALTNMGIRDKPEGRVFFLSMIFAFWLIVSLNQKVIGQGIIWKEYFAALTWTYSWGFQSQSLQKLPSMCRTVIRHQYLRRAGILYASCANYIDKSIVFVRWMLGNQHLIF